MKVAVLGSGVGALAVAADMSRHGRHTVMADLDGERSNLDPVRATGNITVTVTGYGPREDDGPGVGGGLGRHDGPGVGYGSREDDGPGAGGRHTETGPVAVADSVAEALADAELAVVVAPCDAIDRWVHAIAPHTTPDHTVLLAGEGGGAIVARRVIEPPTIIAETNTLPLRARATGPAAIEVTPKRGGVLVASLPATPPDTARVMELIGDVWPHVTATDTVWTTVLTSYDALDAATLDAATLDAATADALDADAADAIAAADAELRALRQALFSRESRGYHDFRMAQGLTPDSPPPNQAPDSATPGIPCGDDNPPEKLPPDSLVGFSPWGADNSPENPRPRSQARQPPSTSPGHAHASTPPAALVLASSLGRAAGVPTPAIDALVSGALALQGRDLADGAPTLAALGLGGLDVTGLVGFARTGYFP